MSGRNPPSRPGGKEGNHRASTTCSGPEANIVEGAAEEVGKGLKAKPKNLDWI